MCLQVLKVVVSETRCTCAEVKPLLVLRPAQLCSEEAAGTRAGGLRVRERTGFVAGGVRAAALAPNRSSLFSV